MFERFTDRARRVVVLAQEEARIINHNYIGTEHLLLGLIHEGQGIAAMALDALGIDLETVRQRVEEIIGRGTQAPEGHIPFTPRAKTVLENSLHAARELGDHDIGTEHILLGLVREGNGVAAQVLVGLGVWLPRLRVAVLLVHADIYSPTKTAREGRYGAVLGRQHEIEQLTKALPPGNGRHPLLVGQRGAGVTSVVHGFVLTTVKAQAPDPLAGVEVLDVDLRQLLGPDNDARATGAVRDSISRLKPGTIVFVRNILMIMQTGGEPGRARPIDTLRPMLASGAPRVIGSATPEEYRLAAADAEIGDLFEKVTVNELPEATVLEIVREARDSYESRHRVSIPDDAIAVALALSGRHIHDRAQPGKALELLDRAAAVAAGRIDNDSDSSIAERLANIRAETGAAVDAHDYNLAAVLHEQELSLLSRQQNRTVNNIPTHRIVEVTEADVSRALADFPRLTPGGEMFERFTDRARRVVVLAQEEARMLNHNYIGTEHLLLGLIHEGQGVAAMALESLGIDLEMVRQQVEEIIGQGQMPAAGHLPFTPRSKKVMEFSLREALDLGHNYVGTEHELLGLIREGEGVAAHVLIRRGAELPRIRMRVMLILCGGRFVTHEAARGRLARVIGRQREIQELTNALQPGIGRHPLLIGEHGVGLTSVVHGFAQAALNAPGREALAGAEIFQVDMEQVFAPEQGNHAGQKLVASLSALDRDTVIFARNILRTRQADGSSIVRSGRLRSMLASGAPRVIGAATPGEYRSAATADAGLGHLFEPIAIRELPEATMGEIMREQRDRCESRHRVAISDDALAAAIELSAHYAPNHAKPGKALDLLDRAAALAADQIGDPVDAQLADVRSRKEAAIRADDFAGAAALRDREVRLLPGGGSHLEEHADVPHRRGDRSRRYPERWRTPRLIEEARCLSGLMRVARRATVMGQEEARMLSIITRHRAPAARSPPSR